MASFQPTEKVLKILSRINFLIHEGKYSCFACQLTESCKNYFQNLMSKALAQKYFRHNAFAYQITIISDIMEKNLSPLSIRFQDLETYIDETEYLHKFHHVSNYIQTLQKILNFYRYHEELPRIFLKKIDFILFKYYDEKRKLNYKKVSMLYVSAQMKEKFQQQIIQNKLKKERMIQNRVLDGLSWNNSQVEEQFNEKVINKEIKMKHNNFLNKKGIMNQNLSKYNSRNETILSSRTSNQTNTVLYLSKKLDEIIKNRMAVKPEPFESEQFNNTPPSLKYDNTSNFLTEYLGVYYDKQKPNNDIQILKDQNKVKGQTNQNNVNNVQTQQTQAFVQITSALNQQRKQEWIKQQVEELQTVQKRLKEKYKSTIHSSKNIQVNQNTQTTQHQMPQYAPKFNTLNINYNFYYQNQPQPQVKQANQTNVNQQQQLSPANQLTSLQKDQKGQIPIQTKHKEDGKEKQIHHKRQQSQGGNKLFSDQKPVNHIEILQKWGYQIPGQNLNGKQTVIVQDINQKPSKHKKSYSMGGNWNLKNRMTKSSNFAIVNQLNKRPLQTEKFKELFSKPIEKMFQTKQGTKSLFTDIHKQLPQIKRILQQQNKTHLKQVKLKRSLANDNKNGILTPKVRKYKHKKSNSQTKLIKYEQQPNKKYAKRRTKTLTFFPKTLKKQLQFNPQSVLKHSKTSRSKNCTVTKIFNEFKTMKASKL